MRRYITSHLSPGLLVAIAAVVLAAAGSATAARLITGQQVKNASLTGIDIKNRSLSADDFGGQVRYVVSDPIIVAPNEEDNVAASCPRGMAVTGGGLDVLDTGTNKGDARVVPTSSRPSDTNGDRIRDSWVATVINGGPSTTISLIAFATCAPGRAARESANASIASRTGSPPAHAGR